MKNKIMKILGIALTLAVLVGLLIPAMPASAGTLSWTTVDLPSKFIDGSNITAAGVSPDGGTILVFNGKYDSESAAGDNNGFAKSTDGGISFNAKGLNDPDDEDLYKVFNGCTQIVFSPKYASDEVIVAVASVGDLGDPPDAFDVYITYDKGVTWETIEDSPGDILCADVSYDTNNKLSIVVGTAEEDGVWLYTEKSGSRWMELSSADPDTQFIDGDVLAVKFSASYADDAGILALTNSDVSEVVESITDPIAILQNVVVEKTLDITTWNESYKFFGFPDDNSDYIAATSGFITLGTDFAFSDGKGFVAINGDTNEVFKVIMSTNSTPSIKKATLMNANSDDDVNTICSLDYSTGKIAIGTDEDIRVNTKADSSTSADDWTSAVDETVGRVPSGLNMLVAFGADAATLFAATANYDDTDFGSVFASSTDYKSFDGLSLINVENSALVTNKNIKNLGTATQYATMRSNSNAVQMIFKSTDTGKNWKEIYSNSITGDDTKLINDLAVKGEDIWIPMKQTNIVHSSNGGVTFDDTIKARTNDKKILAFAGGADYWIGGPDGEIYKNSSKTPVVLDDFSGNEIFALITIPNFFVVVTTPFAYGPPNGPLYFSADGGVTFKKLGDKKVTTQTFDVPNKLIYACEASTNDIYKYNVDTGTDWEKVCTIDVTGFTVGNIDLTGNGVLYVKGSSSEGTEQYLRTVELTKAAPTFEAIAESSVADFKYAAVQAGPTNIVTGDTGNTLYKAVDYVDGPDTDTDPDIPTDKIKSKMMTYTDTLVNGPAITAPAANAQVPSQYTFQWNSISGGTRELSYLLQVATDDKFQGKTEVQTKANSAYATFLIPGKQYYARVKIVGVVADKTLSSFWSPTVAFIVKLDEVNASNSTWIAPAAGATSVSQTPNFQWNSVSNATGYELVIDGAAAIPLTDTVYTLTTPLAYGSTHTWKVRAISGTTAGDWVSGVFTVMAAPTTGSTGPAVTATATTTVTAAAKFFDAASGRYFDTDAQLKDFQAHQTNAPTAPETPAYIWVVIVIGAILVIAVIVLIARTRRV